jgi:hypothetical protein
MATGAAIAGSTQSALGYWGHWDGFSICLHKHSLSAARVVCAGHHHEVLATKTCVESLPRLLAAEDGKHCVGNFVGIRVGKSR